MKTQIQRQENVSRTIQSKTKAANQANVHSVLQKYAARSVQRQADDGLEEDMIQGKFETAQREGVEDEEPLQGKFAIQCLSKYPKGSKLPSYSKAREEAAEIMKLKDKGHSSHGSNYDAEPEYDKMMGDERVGKAFRDIVDNLAEPLVKQKVVIDTDSAVTQLKANKTGLPDDLKSGVEDISGFDMDDVRVHYNSDKPAQLQALAYTQGTDIHVAPGQEKHLPHEVWHVVQQKQGRVQPTMQLQGVNVNDDVSLEKEADEMGRKTPLTRGYP